MFAPADLRCLDVTLRYRHVHGPCIQPCLPTLRQGHANVSAVLDAVRLAGPGDLAATLYCGKSFLANKPASRLPVKCTAGADMNSTVVEHVDWKLLDERSAAWAAGVLARPGVASAGAAGMRPGAPARAPACRPSSARAVAAATEAWPELIDIVVLLVLRSGSAR